MSSTKSANKTTVKLYYNGNYENNAWSQKIFQRLTEMKLESGLAGCAGSISSCVAVCTRSTIRLTNGTAAPSSSMAVTEQAIAAMIGVGHAADPEAGSAADGCDSGRRNSAATILR